MNCFGLSKPSNNNRDNPWITLLLKAMKLGSYPSLNTQSCIKGFVGGMGFLFLDRLGTWVSTYKKSWGPIMSNFWGGFSQVKTKLLDFI